jgi:hypothetical protein
MDYRITIEVKNVADGDVETIAQEVWDKYAEDYDANRGEFDVSVSRRENNSHFDTGWTPEEGIA